MIAQRLDICFPRRGVEFYPGCVGASVVRGVCTGKLWADENPPLVSGFEILVRLPSGKNKLFHAGLGFKYNLDARTA